jgi:hypothetical protein
MENAIMTQKTTYTTAQVIMQTINYHQKQSRADSHAQMLARARARTHAYLQNNTRNRGA